MKTQKTKRDNLLEQVHLAIKNGRMGDELFGDQLESIYSVRSSKELNDEQLKELIEVLHIKGWINGQGKDKNGDKISDHLPDKERNKLYAQLHIALKKGRVTDESYRKWLDKVFSVRSSKELSDDQLRQAVKNLRSVGWLDGKGRGATAQGDLNRPKSKGNSNRPSDKQWNFLTSLSRQMGWNGLEDKALATFVLRIAK
ncbi:MAG: DUF1018 domain-containing protein, partial [Methylococcales bacterium]